MIGTRPTATIASDGSAASARRSSLRERVGLRRQRVEVERPQHQRRRQLLHHVDEHQQQRRRGAAREQRRVHAQQRPDGAGAEAARRGVHAGVMRAKPGSMPFHATAK